MPRKSDIPKRTAAIWDAIAQGSPEMMDEALARPIRAPVVARAKTQPERDLVQRPLVVWLRKHLPDGSVVFAVPNLARSRQQLFSLIRDGMLPGVPDICIITTRTRMMCGDDGMIPHTTPWIGFIECKRPDGGTLTDAQIVVQGQLGALRVPVLAECRSVAEAAAWLKEQGVALR
jgi:hypothetical protein